MKILLVDDDKHCLQLLIDILSVKHHVIESTNNPQHALSMFREAANIEAPFDLVITDFQMPIWSGLTLAMHIANCCTAYEIKVPVICITGDGSNVRRMNERDGKPLALVLDKGCPIADIHNAIKCATERAQGASA